MWFVQRQNPGMTPSTSTPVINVFNRVKNYGSMRGQELAESLSQFVSPGLVRFVMPFDIVAKELKLSQLICYFRSLSTGDNK